MNAPPTMDEEILGFLKGITRRRISRVVMYGLLSIGAIVSAFAPSAVLTEQSSHVLAATWSVMFSIAALVCLVGSVMDRWIAEYTMIPLLSATLIVFGIALVGQSQGSEGWRLIPYAMFFSAFALGLVARWRDVQSLLRVATHLEKEDK